MSSSHSLRDFIMERLTAAADEIFTEFNKTIVQYEEELDRQRRMLEIGCKPQTRMQTTEILPQNIWMKEEILTDQQFCIPERDLILDHGEPEPQQLKKNKKGLDTLLLNENQLLKEEQLELHINVKEKQLEMQLETDSSTVNPSYKGRDIREPELNKDQLCVKISPEPETQNYTRLLHKKSGSSRDEEQKQNERPKKTESISDRVDSPEVERQKKTQNEMFPCKLCGKNFTSRSLSRHLRMHTGERPFSCITCGKGFKKREHLTNHMRTHTGEKPFSCITCGKSFTRRKTLSDHMRTHTGERPFSCITCGKSFGHKSILSTHMRTHTGERPFLCKTCGKSFTRRKTLSDHMRSHTGQKPLR